MLRKCAYAGVILLILLLIAVILPPAGAQSEGSVTRSQTFTVTIAGIPNTVYYVWLKGTFSLSGEPDNSHRLSYPTS